MQKLQQLLEQASTENHNLLLKVETQRKQFASVIDQVSALPLNLKSMYGGIRLSILSELQQFYGICVSLLNDGFNTIQSSLKVRRRLTT